MNSETATVNLPAHSDTLEELETPRLSSARAYWRLACYLIFLAALFVPGFYMDPGYRLPKFNRFMALALYALSVDLIWGYTGLLSLGQGLYFGIGGYIVGYSLLLQKAALDEDKPRFIFDSTTELPPFMFQNRLTEVPSWIAPLIDVWLAIGLAVLLPMIIAGAFGWVVFRRRIKGVYFSLITQAVVLAMFHLVTNQMPYTGGEGGLYNLAKLELFGIEFKPVSMYLLTTGIVVFFALLCYILMHSKLGKILTAIRDNEFRVMALGYNTAMYKTFIFAFAGFMAGLAGALFVAGNRTAGPTFFSIGESIEVVIYVAVGGRGTLAGPILGALLVSEGKDFINENFREAWPVILGSLFVSVVLFLPEGILGGIPRFISFLRIWFYRRPDLSRSWNAVRVGVGLMYWGIVIVSMAVLILGAVAYAASKRPGAAETQGDMFAGLFGSLFYGMIITGSLMALVGLCACWAAPAETPGRKFALGSVLSAGLLLVVGSLSVATPLEELRRVLGLGGFGELHGLLLMILGLAAALSCLFFALFLRGVALFYQNETLAKSARSCAVLFVVFLASNVFLNSLSASAWNVPDHPVLGRFLYLIGMVHAGMMIVLPVWFLRLLYQTHESVNRPLTSF